MFMTTDEVERWIDMKAELDMKMDGLKTKDESGLQSGNFDRP